MRKFTVNQYRTMSERFNKMPFKDKIKTIKENSDILGLACDWNWWAVKILDPDINEDEIDFGFNIENEWGWNEMADLIGLLGLKLTDL